MDFLFVIFLYFYIYSVLGWMVETIYCRILGGTWTNRGFLFGPYCPIYGIGSLIVVYFLSNFVNSPIKVFVLGFIFTSTLEYFTSFILEKMFNAKWWDYSNMKFNINGRVCLLNSTEFAILGLILTYVVHPAISHIVLNIPTKLITLISSSLFVIMLIDLCSTIASLLNLKEKLSILNDFSEKLKLQHENFQIKLSDLYIYKELSELRKKFIEKRNFQIERILAAFPNFEFKDFKKQLSEFKLDLNKFKQDLKLQKMDAKIKKLPEKK